MKVVIVGQAPRSFEHPDDHEVWVINGPEFPPRWDRLFQLHGIEHITRKHKTGFVETLWTIDSPQRLVMTGRPNDPANAEPYPLGPVVDDCGRRYLTNSFALCIALAVHEGATRIVMDGLMIPQGTGQWDAQESWIGPCIEYHLGRAEALGIEVVVPAGCGLFRSSDFVYGFEGPGSV